MNEMITKESALELDIKIKAYANAAWANLVESCKCLKQMRDTKGYEELGYDTFGDYTEDSLGIKERQAYTYISTLENLGERFLQSNANIGITKLSLLNAVPAPDRDDFVKENDITKMSVAEVEQLVKENNGRAEQINLLETELSNKDDNLNDAQEKIAELERKLQEAENRPIEVAVSEPDKKYLDEIKDKAAQAAYKEAEKKAKAERKKLEEKLASEKEKAVSEATSAANDKIKELEGKIQLAEESRSAADKRAEDLKKQLAVSSSPETTKFSFYFDALQNDFEKINESLDKIDTENPDVAAQYREALKRYLSMIGEDYGI